MPSRLDRRRFLLAVATGNPALINKEARRGSAFQTPHEPAGLHPSPPRPLLLPTGIPTVTWIYDTCPVTPMPQLAESGTLGTVITVTYDPDNPPPPISSVTYCYDHAMPAMDSLSSIITYTYDPASQTFSRSRPCG